MCKVQFFFLLYIDEICDVSFDGSIVMFHTLMYADDTCLLFSHKSWHEVYKEVRRGFSQILDSLNDRKLVLNAEKTVFMSS